MVLIPPDVAADLSSPRTGVDCQTMGRGQCRQKERRSHRNGRRDTSRLGAITEVADDETLGERAEPLGGQGHAPGRIESPARVQRTDMPAVEVELGDEPEPRTLLFLDRIRRGPGIGDEEALPRDTVALVFQELNVEGRKILGHVGGPLEGAVQDRLVGSIESVDPAQAEVGGLEAVAGAEGRDRESLVYRARLPVHGNGEGAHALCLARSGLGQHWRLPSSLTMRNRLGAAMGAPVKLCRNRGTDPSR